MHWNALRKDTAAELDSQLAACRQDNSEENTPEGDNKA